MTSWPPTGGVMMLFDGVPESLLTPPLNAVRLTLHPQGLAPRIRNLREWRGHLLDQMRRDIALRRSGPLRALYEEVAAFPVPDTGERRPEEQDAPVAYLSGGGINAMRRWLSLGKDAVDHVRSVLQQHGYTEVADDYASPWLRLHEDGIGSIQFSLNVLARVYADEEVRETCAGTDFTVEDLLTRNGTVCLIASEADAERFAPLLTSIIASIIHGAEAAYNTTGKPLDPGLGVLVDEAGNMLRYPRLPNILTTGRGMGIVVLTVWHDLSQLRDRLGVQKANTVLSASGLRMLLPGCGDLETLRYFSGLYGRTETLRTSHGRSRGDFTTNTSPTETDLAPVHSLQQLKEFTAIAQYSNQPPIKVKMRLTFRDRDLKRLLSAPRSAAGTGPATSDKAAAPAAGEASRG